jgi:hypothetical protein
MTAAARALSSRSGLFGFRTGLLLLSIAWPGIAFGEGAIAVGLPWDVSKQGVAFGVSWGYGNRQEAEARAMKECRSFEGVPATTTNLCKVVETFRGECVAIALDTEPGTPGVGWAVAPTEELAKSSAMERCKRTAGAARQQHCKITNSRCDGP